MLVLLSGPLWSSGLPVVPQGVLLSLARLQVVPRAGQGQNLAISKIVSFLRWFAMITDKEGCGFKASGRIR